jgi:YegS/Rv2252/BmrU family lipid kinase
MRRALVIANPIAGRGAAQRYLREIEHGLGSRSFACDVVLTSQRGDARKQTAAGAERHDLIVVVGGDGTLNEVINGMEADRPVALFPLGTGNVLAKELRLPRRVDTFCEMVARGRERVLDLAAADGRRFVSMAGAGFDAEVAARLAARRSGGIRLGTYVGPILRCLASYPFPRIEATIDGGDPMEAMAFVLISNVRCYGGPFVITPDAVHDDGLLDVCLLHRGTRLGYAWAMLAFALHCGRALRRASRVRGRSIRLTSSERVRYQVDGDPAGFLPATFELLDRKLRCVVP